MADTNTETQNAPHSPTLAGDHYDDDPQVLDSLVQQEAEPPTPRELPQTPLDHSRKPRPVTRLLTRGLNLTPNMGIVQLLPADPDRVSISISTMYGDPNRSEFQSPGIRIADDPGKLETDDASFILPTPARDLDGWAHTGPVWVRAMATLEGEDDALVYVSLMATTV